MLNNVESKLFLSLSMPLSLVDAKRCVFSVASGYRTEIYHHAGHAHEVRRGGPVRSQVHWRCWSSWPFSGCRQSYQCKNFFEARDTPSPCLIFSIGSLSLTQGFNGVISNGSRVSQKVCPAIFCSAYFHWLCLSRSASHFEGCSMLGGRPLFASPLEHFLIGLIIFIGCIGSLRPKPCWRCPI